MAKVTFTQSVNLHSIDLSQIVDGQIDSFTSKEIDLSSDQYALILKGKDFDQSDFSGTVSSLTLDIAGDKSLAIKGLDLPLSQLYGDRGDTTAVLNDVFGGNDVIHGSDDQKHGDYIYGMAGHDRIFGGEGDDTIDGGAGRDFLTGGDGADVYVFSKASDSSVKASDVLLDLQLEDYVDISDLVSHGRFTDRFFYDAGSDKTFYQIDLDNDGVTDMQFVTPGDTTQWAVSQNHFIA